MNSVKKRNLFLLVISVLILVLVVISVAVAMRGPRTSPVEVVSKGKDGTLLIDDLNDGKMTIPDFDIPTSSYDIDKFTEKDGIITYENGQSALGINVNQNRGDIDWVKVKESGVEFAMIRVGYRSFKTGLITPDSKFEENMKGAKEAGVDIGVYFFSQAVTDAEAEEEASFVLQQIQGYQVTYPIAFDWEFAIKDDGSINEDSRTVNCTGEQITGFVDAFCKKIKKSGMTACYYADKAMGYEKLDLSQLSGYDLWYAEYQKAPSFHYDFKIWQYTSNGEVPGISGKVPINIALKSYGS